MKDLARFESRLAQAWEAKQARIPALSEYGTFHEMWSELMKAREKLLPYIQNTIPLLKSATEQNQHVLLEGQLGIMRDLDWGVYPFVTSSSPIAGGTLAGAGIPPTAKMVVTGITKAYTTAVGAGPFPTLLEDEIGEYLQTKGQEYGATTGRKRSCGWLDIPTLKYGAWLNGYTELAMMKIDVLSGLKKIGVCTGYELDGKVYDMPVPAYELERAKPIYEMLEGWNEDLSSCRTFTDLPSAAQNFILQVELWAGVKIKYVSVGPNRDQTIIRSL